MSNILRRFKPRITKKELKLIDKKDMEFMAKHNDTRVPEHLTHEQLTHLTPPNGLLNPNTPAKGVTINFADRVLPDSLYVNVKTGEIKIGVDHLSLKEIEPIIVISPQNTDDRVHIRELVELLHASTFSKVVLDNVTDFKIKSQDEFIKMLETTLSELDTIAITQVNGPL